MRTSVQSLQPIKKASSREAHRQVLIDQPVSLGNLASSRPVKYCLKNKQTRCKFWRMILESDLWHLHVHACVSLYTPSNYPCTLTKEHLWSMAMLSHIYEQMPTSYSGHSVSRANFLPSQQWSVSKELKIKGTSTEVTLRATFQDKRCNFNSAFAPPFQLQASSRVLNFKVVTIFLVTVPQCGLACLLFPAPSCTLMTPTSHSISFLCYEHICLLNALCCLTTSTKHPVWLFLFNKKSKPSTELALTKPRSSPHRGKTIPYTNAYKVLTTKTPKGWDCRLESACHHAYGPGFNPHHHIKWVQWYTAVTSALGGRGRRIEVTLNYLASSGLH